MHQGFYKKHYFRLILIPLILSVVTSCATLDMGKLNGVADMVKSKTGDLGESSDGSILDNMAASGEVKDYGITSDSHSKNTGKIVFSKKGIEFKNEKESSFTNRFMYKGFEADDVYFMAYFPRSFHNQAVKAGVKPSTGKSVMTFSFTVNGKKLDRTGEMDFNGEKFKEWTGFSAGPLNKPGSEPFQDFFSTNVSPLMTAYENKIKVDISFKTKISGSKMWSPAKPAASGEFTVVIEKNKTGQLMPKPGVKLNKNLEAQIIKTLNSEAESYGEVLRVTAPEPDWIIVKNELTGIPVKRELRIAAVVHLKTDEYKVYFYYISQKYTGCGYSPAVYYESVANEEFSIDKKDIYK